MCCILPLLFLAEVMRENDMHHFVFYVGSAYERILESLNLEEGIKGVKREINVSGFYGNFELQEKNTLNSLIPAKTGTEGRKLANIFFSFFARRLREIGCCLRFFISPSQLHGRGEEVVGKRE